MARNGLSDVERHETELARDRRLVREGPSRYLAPHLASKSRLQREPREVGELVTWFLAGWREETPEDIHGAGVWVARKSRVDVKGRPLEEIPAVHLGGSILGSPRFAELFRRLLDNSPMETEEADDGPSFVRPMRAAIRCLAGRDADGERPFMARFVVAVALVDGDWRLVCDDWAIRREIAEVWTREAFRRLYSCYRPDPPARTIRDEIEP
jgi:hypothetical protein